MKDTTKRRFVKYVIRASRYSRSSKTDNAKRKFYGGICFFISLIILVANLLWLHTGDIHQPGYHFYMRGGHFGFWFTTILFSATGILGIYLLLTKEPEVSYKKATELSDKEKKYLKIWYVKLLCSFVLFILSNILLILHPFFAFAVVGTGTYWVYLEFSQKCPNCSHRIAYQGQLMLPRKCSVCRTEFRSRLMDFIRGKER